MTYAHVTRPILIAFLKGLDGAFARPGRLYLIGETTQLWEGWRTWTPQLEVCSQIAALDQAAFRGIVKELATAHAVRVFDESPTSLIPLPQGFEDRARLIRVPTSANGTEPGPTFRHLTAFHFDPYSAAFCAIARGDEPDYHLVLSYLEHGWIRMHELEAMLHELLPRFTAETIQQDPAEFRRKYKGLTQMWRALRPGTTHRPAMV